MSHGRGEMCEMVVFAAAELEKKSRVVCVLEEDVHSSYHSGRSSSERNVYRKAIISKSQPNPVS
jgi:hypothetical protein